MADSLPILVVGATGILGSEICQRLIQNGHHVRGMVRSTSNPDKIDKLKSLGVEIVVGDLKDSKSLCDAVKGVKVVVSPATSTRCRQVWLVVWLVGRLVVWLGVVSIFLILILILLLSQSSFSFFSGRRQHRHSR